VPNPPSLKKTRKESSQPKNERFTTAEVAKILNFPGSRIRSFVRAGFITPARGNKKSLQFTFQDVIFLKTAKGLLESRVPSKRVARMLSALKRQLPDGQHLSSLKIYSDGRRAIAWDGKSRWQPDSGQFLFNFDARAIVQKLKLPLAPPSENQRTAEHWFNLAVELEATSIKEAQRAYHLALALDAKMADAHLNLGKLYHDGNELKKAESHYRAAAENAPHNAAPHFNLGVLLEDLKRPQDAISAYREAIRLDPLFADAHYNLGLLCESLGKKSEAIKHFHNAQKIR
jgi:tetratricopeptide (TPR) repeat protein